MTAIYHVTTLKKLSRYLEHKMIMPPVRAWKNIEYAEKFSKQTGRQIILRLKLDNTFDQLPGHKGNAIVSLSAYHLMDM